MGIWSRLFGDGRNGRRPEAEPEPTDAQAESGAASSQAAPALPTRPEWHVRLERLGQAEGAHADEALAILRQTQGTADQSVALQLLLRALGGGAEHEAVRAACAAILRDRGQADRALELVRDCRSVEAMMLAADLYASRGELPRSARWSGCWRVASTRPAPGNDTGSGAGSSGERRPATSARATTGRRYWRPAGRRARFGCCARWRAAVRAPCTRPRTSCSAGA
jgi:hypothetical protein